jgi:hypothetical protein
MSKKSKMSRIDKLKLKLSGVDEFDKSVHEEIDRIYRQVLFGVKKKEKAPTTIHNSFEDFLKNE